MGYIYGYTVIFICWFLPPFKIYRSACANTQVKVRWITISICSALGLPILTGLSVVVAQKFFGYRITGQSLLFGPLSIILFVANIGSLVLPWLVYKRFKSKFSSPLHIIERAGITVSP